MSAALTSKLSFAKPVKHLTRKFMPVFFRDKKMVAKISENPAFLTAKILKRYCKNKFLAHMLKKDYMSNFSLKKVVQIIYK